MPNTIFCGLPTGRATKYAKLPTQVEKESYKLLYSIGAAQVKEDRQGRLC